MRAVNSNELFTVIKIITSAKEDMFLVVLVCLFVCLFIYLSVRKQDYLQSNERICMVCPRLRTNPLNVGKIRIKIWI